MTLHARFDLIEIDLAVQGGAVLGAEQAGRIAALLLDPRFKIRYATGVSAGLFTLVPVAQILNKHGYTPESRQACYDALYDLWINQIAVDDMYAATAQMGQDIYDMYSALWGRTFKTTADSFKNAAIAGFLSPHFVHIVKDIIHDPEALCSSEHIAVFGETVHKQTGQGQLIHPHELSVETILASMAVEGLLPPQNGYIDGAYAGGSNPPAAPLHHYPYITHDDPLSGTRPTLVLAANPPATPFCPNTNIKTLSPEDLKDTNGMLFGKGLWPFVDRIRALEFGAEIAPTHMIFRSDGKRYKPKDALNNSQTFIKGLFHSGFKDMQQFLQDYGHRIDVFPNMTSDEFIAMAQRNSQAQKPMLLTAA